MGIHTLFHWTAFLHISSRSEEWDWVQSLPPSLPSSSFWQDRRRVFRGLVQVCWRYWQPYRGNRTAGVRMGIICGMTEQGLQSDPAFRTKCEHWCTCWCLVLTSALPQYQMALMTLWLARAAVIWSLVPVMIFTKPAGRSEDWSTWGGGGKGKIKSVFTDTWTGVDRCSQWWLMMFLVSDAAILTMVYLKRLFLAPFYFTDHSFITESL